MFSDLGYLRDSIRPKEVDFIAGFHIGLDQCRRGSVLGDAFVCGSGLPRSLEGLYRDSKTYSLASIHRLAQKLETDCTFALIRIRPSLLDAQNINILFAEAFVELINFLKPERAYVDSAWSDPEKLAKFLRERTSCPQLIVEHKADSKYPAVSVASILCKHKAENQMDLLRQQAGNFGSGYPADPRTKAYLVQFPACPFRRKKWRLS